MQRRDLLKWSMLAPFIARMSAPGWAQTPATYFSSAIPDGRPHRFELSRGGFILDGHPFQIRSGEMHPVRIPREYWLHRIQMARAMGLNTVALCLMWNALESEPGIFDLTTDRRDFAHFIRLCQQEGMWVYLRPGPYVCAEWDFGGLPPYLLREPGLRVRDKNDSRYMQGVTRYLDAIAPVVAPLMAEHGGPILMLQVENEYASFGSDLAYLERLRAMWRQRGIDGPFGIADGLVRIMETRTYLPGAALGLDGDMDFKKAQILANDCPVWLSEGYPGWFTHWGDPHFNRGEFAKQLETLMATGCSFNLYVVHGGTNFGFAAGANANADDSNFAPVITSYDYSAPINERGEPTADYRAFRILIQAHLGKRLPAPPSPPPVMRFAAVTAQPYASLWDNLPPPREVASPKSNEELFAQDHGAVMYRKALVRGGSLRIDGLRDYATVSLDGRYVDYLSRVRKPGVHELDRIKLPAPRDGKESMLDILVDSFGHVGFGAAIGDRKGIVGKIFLDGEPLRDWQVYPLPLDAAFLDGLKPLAAVAARPGIIFRATVEVDEPGDCYLDMAPWQKGYVWVNRHLLGRYWNIGPQHRLFCPASWFRKGSNEVLVLDFHRTTPGPVKGVRDLG
jgi:hypothetical protein